MFHIFLPRTFFPSTNHSFPLTAHQKSCLLSSPLFFFNRAILALLWSRLIQFNKFLRAKVNQLEKGVREEHWKRKLTRTEERKNLLPFWCFIITRFQFVFSTFFSPRCHLSKLKCPIREAHRGVNIYFAILPFSLLPWRIIEIEPHIWADWNQEMENYWAIFDGILNVSFAAISRWLMRCIVVKLTVSKWNLRASRWPIYSVEKWHKLCKRWC